MYKLTHLLGEKEKGEGETKKRIVLGYARVSATKQKKELLRQQEQLRAFAYHQGWQLKKVFTDITSGMNEQRKGLHRLLNEVVIIILLRFCVPMKIEQQDLKQRQQRGKAPPIG